MSYADQVFMQNIREILDHGVWDTDQNVRPHWEDGTPDTPSKNSASSTATICKRSFPS